MSATMGARGRYRLWPAGLWLALSLALTLAAPLAATPVSVRPGDDLGARLAEFPDGVAVVLAPGTYRGPILLQGRSLLLAAPKGATILGDGRSPTVLIRGGAVALEGLVLIGGPGAPALAAEDAGVSLDAVRIDNPGGMALRAQGAQLRVRASRFRGGGPGAAAVALARGTEAQFLASRIEAAGAPALAMRGIAALDLHRTVLISQAVALSADFGAAPAQVTIRESVIAGDGPGVLSVAASPQADVSLTLSVVLSRAAGTAPAAFVARFGGPGFVPLIENSALIGEARSAVVLEAGAGLIARQAVLAGRDRALSKTAPGTPEGALGESLLLPGASLQGWTARMMHGPAPRPDAGDERRVARLAAELATALAPGPAGRPADAAVVAAQATLNDLDGLRARRSCRQC